MLVLFKRFIEVNLTNGFFLFMIIRKVLLIEECKEKRKERNRSLSV